MYLTAYVKEGLQNYLKYNADIAALSENGLSKGGSNQVNMRQVVAAERGILTYNMWNRICLS